MSANQQLPNCRDCQHLVSRDARSCPSCGAPQPSQPKWDGHGFEYRSPYTIAGWPLLHISFRYRPDRRPIPACGLIAIGQFACGLICVGQFTLGLITLSQFTIAGLSIAQFALGYSLIAQYGIYIEHGSGQAVITVMQLFGL